MPSQAATPNEPSPGWEATRLRVTTFLTPAASALSPETWQQVTGAAPEKKVELPKIGAILTEGAFASGKLALRVAPGRVDWVYLVLADPDSSTLPEPAIGPYSDCVGEFIPSMSKWMGTCANVQRLAYGAILELTVTDRQQGYEHLDTLLPDINLDPASEDFRFQINRPRRSTTTGLELRINRLSVWSVASTEWVQLDIGAGVEARRELKRYASRVELDINTAADRKEDLPQQLLSPLLDELVSLGQEIVEKGDVP